MYALAVLLRRHLGSEPFTGIDAQPGPRHDFMIGALVAVLINECVQLRFVGNVQNVISQRVSLRISRVRVLVRKCLVLR